jgi:DNA primase
MIEIDWGAVRLRHPLGDVARRTGFTVADSGWAMVCCPLPHHDDRHPSMQLDFNENRYYCFGCGAHGDVIQWVRDVEALRVTEAVEALDSHRLIHGTLGAGANSRSYSSASPTTTVDLERTPRERVQQALRDAWQYYTFRTLHDRATAYLVGTRQIDVSPLEAATGCPAVGHTPARVDGLSRRLLGEGFTADELVDAALARSLPDGRTIDFFRDRLLLPVTNNDGRVIGLIGRSTLDRLPKYLNQTLTHTYDKSRDLYRPSFPVLDTDANVVVVEGTLDALAIAAQAARIGLGPKYAPVSASGLRLSDIQLEAILTISPAVSLILAADGDDAGRAANRDWASRIARLGGESMVTTWPQGQDPASWIAHFGWEGLVSVTQPGQRLAVYPPPDDVGPVLSSEILAQENPTTPPVAPRTRARRYVGGLEDFTTPNVAMTAHVEL